MTDEQDGLRHVNWNELFGFTQIFKGFRLAIHPSKLMLALAAIVLLFVLGNVMDWIWCWAGQNVISQVSFNPQAPAQSEINAFTTQSAEQFDKGIADLRKSRPGRAAKLLVEAQKDAFYFQNYIGLLNVPETNAPTNLRYQFNDALNKIKGSLKESPVDEKASLEKAEKDVHKVLAEAQQAFNEETGNIEKALDTAIEQANRQIDQVGDKKSKEELREQMHKDRRAAKQALTMLKADFYQKKQTVWGKGIFSALMDYESQCLSGAVKAICHGNFFAGMDNYQRWVAHRSARMPGETAAVAELSPQGAMGPVEQPPGFVYNMLMAAEGVHWLIVEHWVYAPIFLILALAIAALFGGAVNRIAALHFAREEKISMGQALKFSLSKFFSFYTAPLLPIAFVMVLGAALTAGGAIIINWGYVGEILGGLLFLLALLLGLAIAFLLIGLAGGVWLMYPTIAVEGSDSFDAISRSFSYVFARPWRSALYGLVALVYGAVTYLFVRLFVYIALASTHFFVKWGVFAPGDGLEGPSDKLDVIWATPTFDKLWGTFNWPAMSVTEKVGAFIIGIWVFLIASLVLAYLLTYAASSTTSIYFLLRRKVDATDLDDVYVEETEEPAPAGAAEEAKPAEAPPPPPAQGSGDQAKPPEGSGQSQP